jgi:hypothetical protein
MKVWHLGWLLAVPACTSANATLADLPDLRVHIDVRAARDDGPTSGSVLLMYDYRAFHATHGADCATLGSFRSALTNASITNVTHGSSPETAENESCLFPSFEFDAHFTPDEPTTLIIRDDSKTITAEYSADTFAPQVPMLRSASDWKFAPGEQVAIGWPHPEDLAIGEVQAIVDFVFEGDDLSFTLLPTFVGDEIRFTAPDPPIHTGRGAVELRFGATFGAPVSCTGAYCTFNVERGYVHSAELTK